MEYQNGAIHVVDSINVESDLRTLLPGNSLTLTATTKPLDWSKRYKMGLRILQPGADKEKDEGWKLNARNVYVVTANDIEVIDGVWDENKALRGGWNMLGDLNVQATIPQLADEGFFPFQGSFRPIDQP